MSDDILARLAAPFPPDIISWRVGSTTKDKTKGMALAYIDARDVQDRLNQVCGLNWQVRNPWSVNGKLACEIGIKVGDEWVWRGDGAGDSDVEAEKGAFSDAFKRAAVRFGIGRYLYDVDSPWVALEPKGTSHVIAPSEIGKLRACLGKASGVRAASPPPVEKEPDYKAQEAVGTTDPQAAASAMKDLIDGAKNLIDLNFLISANGLRPDAAEPTVGSRLFKIKAYSESAYAFLLDRAQKKRGTFLTSPPQRKAS